jgi:hypothetical protein
MSVSTAARSSEMQAISPPRWQVALTIIAAGVPAFLIGRVIWPDAPGAANPPAPVLPVFILVSAVEALLFGVGVAFVIFGRRRLGAFRSKLANAAFVAIAWTLISWWPHDNFHRVSHDWYSLAAIEVGFHLTLIASIVVIALYFLRTLRAQVRS